MSLRHPIKGTDIDKEAEKIESLESMKKSFQNPPHNNYHPFHLLDTPLLESLQTRALFYVISRVSLTD